MLPLVVGVVVDQVISLLLAKALLEALLLLPFILVADNDLRVLVDWPSVLTTARFQEILILGSLFMQDGVEIFLAVGF